MLKQARSQSSSSFLTQHLLTPHLVTPPPHKQHTCFSTAASTRHQLHSLSTRCTSILQVLLQQHPRHQLHSLSTRCTSMLQGIQGLGPFLLGLLVLLSSIRHTGLDLQGLRWSLVSILVSSQLLAEVLDVHGACGALQTHGPCLRAVYGGGVIDGPRIRNISTRVPFTGQLQVDPYTDPYTEYGIFYGDVSYLQ